MRNWETRWKAKRPQVSALELMEFIQRKKRRKRIRVDQNGRMSGEEKEKGESRDSEEENRILFS